MMFEEFNLGHFQRTFRRRTERDGMNDISRFKSAFIISVAQKQNYLHCEHISLFLP